MLDEIKGENDSIEDQIKQDREDKKDAESVKIIIDDSMPAVMEYKVKMHDKVFDSFLCQCCRVQYPLNNEEEAIAHQLFGNILIGGQGRDPEAIRKSAVLQIKYVAKQSGMFDSMSCSWSYNLNGMLAHMMKYFDNPFNVLRFSIDYLEYESKCSVWNFICRSGQIFADIFRKSPKAAAKSCVAGYHGGFGINVTTAQLMKSDIDIVPAKPILDYCSGVVDVSVPFGTIRQIGQFVCAPTFYRVGVSIGSSWVTVPRKHCSHNQLTFLQTRQCTPPLYYEDPRWRLGKLTHNDDMCKAVKLKFGEACHTAFVDLHTELKLPSFDMNSEEEIFEWFLSSRSEKDRERMRKGWNRKRECWRQVENDSVVGRAFGKVEAMCGKERDEVQMRCVTSMTDEYLAESGPLYQWWSKLVLKFLYPDFHTMISQPVIIVTGMDPRELGKIVTHFEKEGFYVAQGDHSRFDGHCEEEMIDAENWFYAQQGCFPEWHLELLKAQRCTRGTTSTFAYSHKGKVASGKINTSFGDSLINAAMWVSFAKANGIVGSTIVVCGDDHIVFTRDFFPAREYNQWCRNLGHKNSFEWLLQLKSMVSMDMVSDYDRVSFCSSWFMKYNTNGDRVTLPTSKMLVKTFIPINPLAEGKTMDTHISEVAAGFGFLDWYPVFGAFFQLLRKGRNIKPKYEAYQFRMITNMLGEIDHEIVAIEFANRYGFDPSQLHEAILRLQLPEGLGVDIKHPLLDRMADIDGVLINPH
jgi:hypothetical protein